jgi:carnitine O-acetyltransferase
MFYSFPALWPDTGDVAVDESEVMEILRAIQRVSSQTGGPAGLGALTTLPRSKWAAARAKLCEVSERNRESLRMIDSALFVLVLDDWSPKSVDEAAGNMLGGTSHRDRIDCNNAGTCLNR